MRFSLITGLLLFFFTACQNGNQKETLVPLDLLKYGIPITVMAPDSAEVKMMDMGLLKDVTIKKGDNFYVQIYASQAATTDPAKVLAQQLIEVKENRYFSKIIKEEPMGFLYETAIDSSLINYGFRHVRIQGDQEFIFQTGLIGTFSLEDVENMYTAVQAK